MLLLEQAQAAIEQYNDSWQNIKVCATIAGILAITIAMALIVITIIKAAPYQSRQIAIDAVNIGVATPEQQKIASSSPTSSRRLDDWAYCLLVILVLVAGVAALVMSYHTKRQSEALAQLVEITRSAVGRQIIEAEPVTLSVTVAENSAQF